MERTKQTKEVIKTAVKKGTIMTNDPSLTAWGWVVVSFTGEILDGGCIKTENLAKKLRTRKGDDDIRRITELSSTLLNVMIQYNVCYLVSELPHGSQSSSAAGAMGMVKGILQTLAVSKNLGIEWYSENDSKMCTLKKRSATKTEMVKAIDNCFKHVPWGKAGYINEAIADALSVYNVALRDSSALKLMKNGQ